MGFVAGRAKATPQYSAIRAYSCIASCTPPSIDQYNKMSKNAGIPQHFKDAFPNLPGNPVFESQAWLKNDLISCLLSPSGEDSNEIISFLEQHLPQPSRQV